MFTGRGLVLGGTSEINKLNPPSYIGDLSSIIIDNLPLWAELHRTPSKSISLMAEWEAKMNKIVKVTAVQNITTLAGVPSWTLVLLRKVLAHTGAQTINQVWPNLETYTHGGVSFIPFKKQFDEIFNLPNLHYMETYNASEGFFGYQDVYGANYQGDLLLMIDHGVFYEFIPMDHINQDQSNTLSLHQVELHTPYALVISTNAGLWRYQIGDILVFTHLYPFRFRITGRTQQCINVFGEELMIANVEKAIQIACDATQSVITEFTGCPIFMDNTVTGGHQWLMEFAKSPADLDEFTVAFDNALKSLNSDYQAKRYKDFVLNSPIIQCVVENTFYDWMKQRGKLGGQHKVPRLSNSRKYVDEILAM